jgi:hypothetical protein
MIPHKSSSKPIAVVVVAILGVFALACLFMVYDLSRAVITKPGSAQIAATAVALIGSITTLCGTALGFVGGTLIQTEKLQQGNPNVGSAGTVNVGTQEESK